MKLANENEKGLEISKKSQKSIFIVLDGVDGSGKGEMLLRLHKWLFSLDKKYRILTTREPTYGTYGKLVREILKNDKDPIKNKERCLDLFIKDRKQHIENTISPFLAAADGDSVNIVICDRYYYSTIAFQHTQGIDLQKVIDLNKDLLKPDIAFILDVPVETALERMGIRGKDREKFEDKKFMEKLRENYLELKDKLKDNITIIDANKTKDQVFEAIKKEVKPLL